MIKGVNISREANFRKKEARDLYARKKRNINIFFNVKDYFLIL